MRDIEHNFGAVEQVQSRGASLKVMCKIAHQKDQILRSVI